DGKDLRWRYLHEPQIEQYKILAYFGNQIRGELGESNANRRYRSRLDHREETPSVQKCDKPAICLLQVNILATGTRIHSAKFTIAYSGCYGHEARDNPNGDEPSGTANIPKNIGAHDEDTGSNHGTRHEHGSVPKSQYRLELAFAHDGILRFSIIIQRLQARPNRPLPAMLTIRRLPAKLQKCIDSALTQSPT